jgi:periplasmic protein TonB
LPIAHCPLPIAHCPLLITHCPLPIAHCPLPTAIYGKSKQYHLIIKQALVSKILIHLTAIAGNKATIMKTALILKSDVLDIIFDNRNKAYGAYNLRKFYNNRLLKSLGIMLGVVVVLSAFTFMPKKKVVAKDGMYETIICHLENPQKEKIKEIEKPKANQPPKQKAPTQTWAKPVISNSKEPVKPLNNLSDSVVIASTTVTGEPGNHPVIIQPANTGEGGPGVIPEPTKPAIDINTPTYNPEVMPAYPGGMEALRKFLQRNLINPKAMEEGEEVSVKVKFVVDYDGNLKSFVTVQDGGEEFNKEVIRVLNKMPNWIPGKSNGQNVSVYYTIPVKFVAGN